MTVFNRPIFKNEQTRSRFYIFLPTYTPTYLMTTDKEIFQKKG